MRRHSLLMAIALASCCGLALAQSQTPSSDGTKKKGFVGDISDLTEKNSDFRRVLDDAAGLDDQPVAALVAIDLGGVAHGVLRHAVPSAGETWVSIPPTVASWVAGSTRAPYWMAMTPSITASAVPRVTTART